jgi:hypothetical protein
MRAVVTLCCLLLMAPSAAQYQPEEQTLDHEEQDSSYFERQANEPKKDASLEEFLERAEGLIRDRNYRAAGSERYRVQSDDPRLDAEAALNLLEAFRSHFERFWSDRVELADYEGQSRVFLFYSFHKFNQMLAGDFRFNSIRPKGHYGSLFDVITVHTDAGCPGALGNSLVHEAAHQLSDQRLFGAEQVRTPPWLSEGLASYFGFTLQDSSGNFLPGKVGGKLPLLHEDARGQGCSEIKAALRAGKQAFKAAQREGESLIEELLLTGGPDSFYGPRVEANYAVSWILVHYLLHGEDGIHAAPFASYLALTGGEPESLLDLLGMSTGQLDAALERHLKTLKVQ